MSKDEEDQDAANIGVGKYPCMPSLVALQQMKNRLHLANLGKKLMKWTALATGKEIRKVAAELLVLYADFSEQIANCYILLARSRFYYANLNKMVIEDIQKQANIVVATSVKPISAGVKAIVYGVIETEKPPYPYLGIDKGGGTIDKAKIAWANLLKKMIMILQLRRTYLALDEAHKSATKKQNVLSKLVIPKLVTTIKYIMSELEELAREDTFRLKTFKKSKLKALAAKKQGVCSCCLNHFQLGSFDDIDKDKLTCPKCAKGASAVSAQVVVCGNVGDKVMRYLEEHKDEINEWAKTGGNILTKPCCSLKDLPFAPLGTCVPETIDVSFMNKVAEIPPAPQPEPVPLMLEPEPVEPEPVEPEPVIVEPEPCVTCTIKPDIKELPAPCVTCKTKPEIKELPVPCVPCETKPEIKELPVPCVPCKTKPEIKELPVPCVPCETKPEIKELPVPCVTCKTKPESKELPVPCVPCKTTPEIKELPIPCVTCKTKPESKELPVPCVTCKTKPESKELPVPCVPCKTKSDVSRKELPVPCFPCKTKPDIIRKELPEPICGPCTVCSTDKAKLDAKTKAKGDTQTEPSKEKPKDKPHITTCPNCKASTLDGKPCTSCVIEDIIDDCIPCKMNRYDDHNKIRFPKWKPADPCTPPCSISIRMTSSTSHKTSVVEDKGNIVEKVIKITRKINPDGTVNEEKQVIIRTKLIRTASAASSARSRSKHSRSPSRSPSRSNTRVKYEPSVDGTVPCSCKFMTKSQLIDQCIRPGSPGALEDLIEKQRDKAILTSATSIKIRVKSMNNQLNQPSGDQKAWDTQSDVLKLSCQMYEPKVRSCISENQMYSPSELESRGIFEPSNTSFQLQFKSQALNTAKNEIRNRSNAQETSDTETEATGKSNKTSKSQKFVCDPAFVSVTKKYNKLFNKHLYRNVSDSKLWLAKSSESKYRNTSDSKLWLAKSTESKVNGKMYPSKVFSSECNYLNDCKKAVSSSFIEQIYDKQFDEKTFKAKLSVSTNNVKPYQTICKECLKELCGYIPPRKDFERKFPDCKYCQRKIKKQLNIKIECGTSPNFRSSIFLSCTSGSINSLGHSNRLLLMGFGSRKENNINFKHDSQISKASPVSYEKNVKILKDVSLVRVDTTNDAQKIGLDIGVSSLMNDLYRKFSTGHELQKLNDLPMSSSSLNFEINKSREGTSQEKGTLPKCNRRKSLQDEDQVCCTSSLSHLKKNEEDDNNCGGQKYKTNYEIRNIFVANNNWFENLEPSPDSSPKPSPEPSAVSTSGSSKLIQTNNIEELLCDGFCVSKSKPKNWVFKPVEPTLYRRVRENDLTVYNHSSVTATKFCDATTSCHTTATATATKYCDTTTSCHTTEQNSQQFLCSTPTCRKKLTPICCDKTCHQRQGLIAPDIEHNDNQDYKEAASATNNMPGERENLTVTNCTPAANSEEETEPMFKDAGTCTKRSGKYDVRCLSQIPKLRPESLTGCPGTIDCRATRSFQAVCRSRLLKEQRLKCCRSFNDFPNTYECNRYYYHACRSGWHTQC